MVSRKKNTGMGVGVEGSGRVGGGCGVCGAKEGGEGCVLTNFIRGNLALSFDDSVQNYKHIFDPHRSPTH